MGAAALVERLNSSGNNARMLTELVLLTLRSGIFERVRLQNRVEPCAEAPCSFEPAAGLPTCAG